MRGWVGLILGEYMHTMQAIFIGSSREFKFESCGPRAGNQASGKENKAERLNTCGISKPHHTIIQ